ncbi:cbb3-type cytochrome c oxidase subunit I [Ammoniphilus oxalaticus]
MYLLAGGFFFLLGGLEALLIRIQLMYPDLDIFVGGTFNQLLTMHGTTMIFFAAMPIIFALLNAIVPLQIGARDVAFPFINALGLWLFFLGGVILNASWFLGAGAPEAGWTAYAPLSTPAFSHMGVDFYVLGLQVAGIGTWLGGINFLVTIINMRAPGLTFMRLPMFTWTAFVTSALVLFAFPAITVNLILLMFDRLFGGAFFNADMGGNVVIWQHLFWIFGHPEVYILILPAFGIVSDVISTFSKKRLFGHSAMVFATVLIGFLGFMVWAHHMFTVGMGPIANSLFALATMLIAVPTGIKIFNWLFTMWGGQVRINTASLWSIGFIPTFLIGGMTGVMLGVAPADFQYQDTYFVIAHFHYTIVGGMVFGLFSGMYYWWPKMFGKMLNEKLGKWNFWTFFIGFNLTFFPQHFLGLMGMPRRVFTFLPNAGLEMGNFVSTIGAFGMTLSILIFLLNIVITNRSEQTVPADPWDGRTLEWTIPSPAPEYNFAQTPLVRGLDALWVEKMEGNGQISYAEPLGRIHMPSPSVLPFLMAIGLTFAAFGFIYHTWFVAATGLIFTFVLMSIRSVKDDPGYYIEVEDIDEGVKV